MKHIDEWDAWGFNPQVRSKRFAGNVRLTPKSLVFSYDGGRLDLPVHGLKGTVGGAGNRYAFFSHPQFSEWEIYCDKAILANPAFEGNFFIKSEAGKANFSSLISKAVVGILLLAVLGIGAGIGWFLANGVDAVIDRIPKSWDRQLGEKAFAAYSHQIDFIEDEKVEAGLAGIAAPLVNVWEGSGFEFEFHVANDDAVNAFALPGGIIVVNSGLLLKAKSPEEVAGVIAHEIGHCTRRHQVRRLVQAAGVGIAVHFFLNTPGRLMKEIAEKSSMLIGLSYSRDQEREADEAAWDKMLEAGLNPEALISLFETLKGEQKAMGGSMLTLISTHPGLDERIEYVRWRMASLPEEKEFREIPLNWQEFQQSLRAAEN